ncbi:acyl carrier protein [Microbacterium arabinogalactanolyticum]|uniref:acyl carrier protein n=1 Tax=Microbacterium arabinogalactanolyticum TaxID=69365 RepID=UPI00404492F5
MNKRPITVKKVSRVISSAAYEVLDVKCSPQELLDAGMDSLDAVEIAERVGASFSVYVPAHLLYDADPGQAVYTLCLAQVADSQA